MNFLISFGIYSNQKLSKYIYMLHFQHLHTELPNEFLLIQIDQDLFYMLHPLF